MSEGPQGILPETRKLIVILLAVLTAGCIVTYAVLAIYSVDAASELLTLAGIGLTGIVGVLTSKGSE